VDSLLDAVGDSLRCMRDASRGGVASVLHALANASCVGVAVDEASIPVRTPVADACAILGVHPLHVASEGRLVAIVARAAAERALEALRSIPGCDDAADIGEVVAGEGGPLLLRSASGALRGLDLEGVDRLTRLC
jgi:hydrogenase expression/formation protein HypE